MIFHGILQIINHTINSSGTLNYVIKTLFQGKLLDFYELENKTKNVDLKKFINYLEQELLEIGFVIQDINYFFSRIKKFDRNLHLDNLIKYIEYLEKSIYPVIEELFLWEFLNYLANIRHPNLLSNLKRIGLPIEILIRAKRLKDAYEIEPVKAENLKNYIVLKETIINFLFDNKEAVIELQKEDGLPISLQLLYYIHRIISLFNLEKSFDFSTLREYLEGCCEDYLQTIPLVTLKNPDLYYCGIFLAAQLDVIMDKSSLESYFSSVYEEILDDFDAPFIQGTRRLYYLLKTMDLFGDSLTNVQINHLMNEDDSNYYDHAHLRALETSRLVVILKIFKMLNIMDRIDPKKIKIIQDEIKKRLSSVKNEKGKLSTELIYYTLFYYYTINKMDTLNEFNILKEITKKIYRNLAILVLDKDTCNDLLSEILYSLESLRLLNSINSKETYSHLIQYLFPKVISPKDMKNHPELRMPTINKITGDFSI